MSITITRIPDSEDVWGKTRIIACDITLDTSYPATNGYVINASDVGLVRITGAKVLGGNKASGALMPMLDFGTLDGRPNSSVALRLFYPTGGGATAPAALADPTGSAAAQAITMGGEATGAIPAGATPVTSTGAQPDVSVPADGLTATAAASATTLTPGKGKEVKDATNLSTIAFRVQFFGF